MDAADDYTVSGQNFEIEQTVQREGGRLLNFIRMRVRDETEA